MDVYNKKIRSDGSIDKLKLIFVVIGYLQNKNMIGYIRSPKSLIMTQNYFSVDSSKHKARSYQLDFIGAFLQANVKHSIFVKLDSRYG